MSLRLAVAIEINEGSVIVAENFGKCTKFNIYELDNNGELFNTESLFNPLEGEDESSSQLPLYISQYNVQTIITGYMEPKAVSNFNKYGIKVIIAPGILIKDVLNLFVNGKLKDYKVYPHLNK